MSRCLKVFIKKLFSANFLLGPAIWCLNSEPNKIHRRMVRHFRPSHKRWKALANVTLCYISWYVFASWFSLLLEARRLRKSEKRGSLADLVYLVYWIGAKPDSYYLLRLYDHSKSDWLLFVYPQEFSHWHSIQSTTDNLDQRMILNDKEAFSKYCLDHQIAVVENADRLEQGEKFIKDRLFKQKSVFLKPACANALRGCMALEFCSPNYSLRGWDLNHKPVRLQAKEPILKVIQNMVDKHRVLIQPLLENHASLSKLSSVIRQINDLSTIRVFTTMRFKQSFALEAAVLQVAHADGHSWDNIRINVDTGYFNSDGSDLGVEEGCMDLLKPFWPEVCEQLGRAHNLFSSIPVIAWDVAFTDSGPIIIEGNWGWSPLAIQNITSGPLLKERMLEVYRRSYPAAAY